MIQPAGATARLAGVASAVPKHTVDRAETLSALLQLFPGEAPEFIAGLVERSGVERRHVAFPVADILVRRNFTVRNALYRTAARDLALQAARAALAKAGVAAESIDAIVDVSCTGIAIPALDVDLVPALGLRSDVKRIPITESGCAAGALAIGLASDLARTGMTTLVVAVELCSMTLCGEDLSRTNLVASVLFGDGAAAAVITPEGTGPKLFAVGSHLFHDTRGLMGFDVGEQGLRIVLQRELPITLERELRGAVDAFLARHGRTSASIGLHLVHPGGRRILESYQRMFDLRDGALRFSAESLRRYGNLSSASILTVLELALDERVPTDEPCDALLVGIGPGLSLEMSLWSWNS